MLKHPPSTFSDERGAAAVEFALVAPLLIALILGTVEIGRVGLVWASTRDAVVTASRLYRLHPLRTDEQVIAAVKKRANGYGPGMLREPTVAASWCLADGRPVQLRRVSATVQHRLLVPFAADRSFRITYATSTPVHSSGAPTTPPTNACA